MSDQIRGAQALMINAGRGQVDSDSVAELVSQGMAKLLKNCGDELGAFELESFTVNHLLEDGKGGLWLLLTTIGRKT